MKPLFILFTFLLVLTGCGNDAEQQTEAAHEVATETQPYVDTSAYQIRFGGRSQDLGMYIAFKEDLAYDQQFDEIKTILKRYEEEVDISKLQRIELDFWVTEHRGILPLFPDIVDIPEIKEHIAEIESGKERVVNSVYLISPNLHQSKLINQFTDLFKPYGVVPKDYIVEKCRFDLDHDPVELYCPFFFIYMKPAGE